MLTFAESQSAWNIEPRLVCDLVRKGRIRLCHGCASKGSQRAEIRCQAMLREIEPACSLCERIEAALTRRERRLSISPPGVDHLQLGGITIVGDFLLRLLEASVMLQIGWQEVIPALGY